MNDVLERLSSADPAREQLSPEEQREADALLARIVSSPPGDAAVPAAESLAPPRRRGLPRFAFAATGLAAAAVAAFAAIALVGSDGPSTAGAVDKAVAATTRPNTIYHLLERIRANGYPGNRPITNYRESWYTTNGRFRFKGYPPGRRPGKLADDFAGRLRPGRNGGPALRYDPRRNEIYPSGLGFRSPKRSPSLDPFSGPGLQLRQLRHDGKLKASGTTELDGRSAIRLVSGLIPDVGETKARYEYLVDSRSYLPLRLRVTYQLNDRSRVGFVSRYLTYERLPLNSKTEGVLALGDHPGAKCVGSFRRITGQRDPGFPHRCLSR